MNLEPPDSDEQIAAARALRRREAKDPIEVQKYLKHCERVILDHLRANGWPVDDYDIRLVMTQRPPPPRCQHDVRAKGGHTCDLGYVQGTTIKNVECRICGLVWTLEWPDVT